MRNWYKRVKFNLVKVDFKKLNKLVFISKNYK